MNKVLQLFLLQAQLLLAATKETRSITLPIEDCSIGITAHLLLHGQDHCWKKPLGPCGGERL